MKMYIMAIIAIMTGVLQSYGQDIIDPQPLFNKINVPQIQSQTNEFVRGWNWESIDRRLDSAMNS